VDQREQARNTLKEARRWFTQRVLAQKLGVTPRTIIRWEGGAKIPTAVAIALREILASDAGKGNVPGEFTFIDLFAGIGGIRMGFEAHGGRCIYTSEWDLYSQKTYRENFGNDHLIHGDITKIHEAEIPDHDVLLAGFPCQPFSIAGVSKKKSLGRAHGFLDETQGTLFFDLARILNHKRPKAFLLHFVPVVRDVKIDPFNCFNKSLTLNLLQIITIHTLKMPVPDFHAKFYKGHLHEAVPSHVPSRR